MASSRKLHELLQIKPKAPQFRVYGKVDQGRIEYLLDVLTTENGLEATEIMSGLGQDSRRKGRRRLFY
jgi:hypothetical protein